MEGFSGEFKERIICFCFEGFKYFKNPKKSMKKEVENEKEDVLKKKIKELESKVKR